MVSNFSDMKKWRENSIMSYDIWIVKRVGEKSEGNLSSFIIKGCDEKPWVISGMEDGTSNPNTITHKGLTIHTVLDHDTTNMLLYLELCSYW